MGYFIWATPSTPVETSGEKDHGMRGVAQSSQEWKLLEKKKYNAVVSPGRGGPVSRLHPQRAGKFPETFNNSTKTSRDSNNIPVIQVTHLSIEDIIKDVNSDCRKSQTRGCQAARWVFRDDYDLSDTVFKCNPCFLPSHRWLPAQSVCKEKHQFQGSHGTCGETVMGVYTMLMTPKNLLGTSELSKVKPVP